MQPVWPTYVISQSGQGIRFTTPFCWSEGTGSFGFTRMWDRVWWCLKYVRVLRGVRTHLIDSERFRMYGNSYNCGLWRFCIGTSASALCYQSLAGISVWNYNCGLWRFCIGKWLLSGDVRISVVLSKPFTTSTNQQRSQSSPYCL